ncbi:MAG: ABC transporter permease [Planctomycetes bacterium]|nr:ABC transporter permease [Planctomycetota bacterium]
MSADPQALSASAPKAALTSKHTGMVVILVLLFITSAVLSTNFLTANNLMNIFRQIAITGIVAMGMMVVLITGGIDLSVASVLSTSTLIVAGMKAYHPLVVVGLVVLFGLFTGLVNGVLVARFKVPAFIVTLGTMSVFQGIGLTYSKSQPIARVPEALKFVGKGRIFDIVPVQGIIFIIVAVIIGFMLRRMKIGRYIYAIGANEKAARLSGIDTVWYKTAAYVLCSLTAALGGIVMAAHLNVGEATIARGAEMDVIAGCVIGGTSLAGGKGTAFGTLMGVLIIGMFQNLLNLLNIPGYTQPVFKGMIIVAAALFQSLQEQRRASK